MGANRYCLFYPFYRLSDPVLLLQVDSFEEDRVLSGAGILGVVIFANIFAGNQKDELINRKSAIVFAPTVTVKSSPDASGTDLFILHEGTKVSIKEQVGRLE